MPWTPDVPIPAELLGKCRGCDAPIGWIRRQLGDETKPHPVEVRGWHGAPTYEGAPGSHTGYTLDGDRMAVREVEPDLFNQTGYVVFVSHFAACPKHEDFRRGVARRTST